MWDQKAHLGGSWPPDSWHPMFFPDTPILLAWSPQGPPSPARKSLLASLGFGEGRRKGVKGEEKRREGRKEGKKVGRKEEGIRFNPFRSAIVNINQLLLLLVPRWNVSLKRWKIKKGKKKISGEESWSECSWTGDIPGTIVSAPLVGLLNSRMGQTIWVCHTHPQHPARPAMLVTKASQVTSLAAIC